MGTAGQASAAKLDLGSARPAGRRLYPSLIAELFERTCGSRLRPAIFGPGEFQSEPQAGTCSARLIKPYSVLQIKPLIFRNISNKFPFEGIISHIFDALSEIIFIPDHVVVITSLPKRRYTHSGRNWPGEKV